MARDLFNLKKIKLHTIQMGQWRLAEARKIPLIDITAKAKSPFSHSMAKVTLYKSGMLSEVDYTATYIQRMRESLRDNPEAWNALLDMPELAFACYCNMHDFCHRFIFIDLFKKYAESKGFEVELMGEIIKDK